MNGIDEMEIKYNEKIKNVVSSCTDISVKHYVNYLSNLSFRTKYTYTCIVVAFLKSVRKESSALNFDDFNSYISEIKYMDNNETKTSSYLITVYSALKKYSEYLFKSKRIEEDYMLGIARPKAIEKQKTTLKREEGYLTESEIKRLLKHLDEDPSSLRGLAEEWKLRNKAIIYLFLYTGMRCSALTSINVNDVNFNNKTLIVTDKGSKVRTYEIPDDLCELLNKWITERNKMEVDTEALFISMKKFRIANNSVASMLKTYIENSGIKKNITPHKLRATYGTQLYNKTGDIYFVQDCMGHNSPNTTKLYIRGNRKNTKRASEIMNGIIG